MACIPAGARAIFRGTGVSPCPPGELGGQGSFFPMGLFLYGSVTSLAACVVDNFRENGIIAEGAFPQRERVKKKRRGVAQLVARLLWEQDAGSSSLPTRTNFFQKSERAHCAAPPFQIEPASLGFDLVLGAVLKENRFYPLIT